MWWLHCTIMLLHVPTVGCAVTSNILLGFVDVTIFERGCAYCDTGNFLEKSLQRLKKRRLEVKIFLNYIAVKDRSLTAELVSKCDSIELVWSNQLGPQKKKNWAAFFSHCGAWFVPGYPDMKLSETSLFSLTLFPWEIRYPQEIFPKQLRTLK